MNPSIQFIELMVRLRCLQGDLMLIDAYSKNKIFTAKEYAAIAPYIATMQELSMTTADMLADIVEDRFSDIEEVRHSTNKKGSEETDDDEEEIDKAKIIKLFH